MGPSSPAASGHGGRGGGGATSRLPGPRVPMETEGDMGELGAVGEGNVEEEDVDDTEPCRDPAWDAEGRVACVVFLWGWEEALFGFFFFFFFSSSV